LSFVNGQQFMDFAGVYVRVTLGSEGGSVAGSIRTLYGARATPRLATSPIPGSTFDAIARPILDDIAGSWDMADLLDTPGAMRIPITIGNDGKLTGTYRQCAFDGAVEPSRDGSTVFAVRLKAKGCFIDPQGGLGLEDFGGFIVASPLAAGDMQTLFWPRPMTE
jgi:hypothetical protein